MKPTLSENWSIWTIRSPSASISQRPFGKPCEIPRDPLRHGVCRRFFAPHCGAFEKSPGGFPCFSQPRRTGASSSLLAFHGMSPSMEFSGTFSVSAPVGREPRPFRRPRPGRPRWRSPAGTGISILVTWCGLVSVPRLQPDYNGRRTLALWLRWASPASGPPRVSANWRGDRQTGRMDWRRVRQ